MRHASGTIDAILDELDDEAIAISDPTVEMLAIVTDLHAAGLAQLMGEVDGSHRPPVPLLQALARDHLVASVLLVHGLHPEPLDRRLARTLADIDGRSGAVASVELVELTDLGAHLRVEGASPNDAYRLRLDLERALAERVPDLVVARIDGGERAGAAHVGLHPDREPERTTEHRDGGADMNGVGGRRDLGGSVLERLARRGPPARLGERCEMCGSPVADEHGHVVDVHARGMLCVCRPCYLLFTPEGSGHDHFRAVPDRYLDLGRDSIGPQLWDRLEVPVGVAFFFRNSVLGRIVGQYPGPGGATESELAFEAWEDLVAAVPGLADMVPDVEALLVRGELRRRRGLSGAGRPLLRPDGTAAIGVAGNRRGRRRRDARSMPASTTWPGGADRYRPPRDGRPMTELSFDVLDITADRFGAVPTLTARLRIAELTGEVVHMVALRTQIKIDAHIRRYDEAEQARLAEQFGEPERWADTLRPFTWTHATAMVPGFTGTTEFDLPIPCTYDLEVLGSRFFESLDSGKVPLEFLFSGTLVTRGDTGFAVTQVPWHKSAPYALPVAVWRELMDAFYPNSGWIRLHRDTVHALLAHKGAHAIPSWDQMITELLALAAGASSS